MTRLFLTEGKQVQNKLAYLLFPSGQGPEVVEICPAEAPRALCADHGLDYLCVDCSELWLQVKRRKNTA